MPVLAMHNLTYVMSKLTFAASKLISVQNKPQLMQQGNKFILPSFHFKQTSPIALEVSPKQLTAGSTFLFCKQNALASLGQDRQSPDCKKSQNGQRNKIH
jgi:hypothetical protein